MLTEGATGALSTNADDFPAWNRGSNFLLGVFLLCLKVYLMLLHLFTPSLHLLTLSPPKINTHIPLEIPPLSDNAQTGVKQKYDFL